MTRAVRGKIEFLWQPSVQNIHTCVQLTGVQKTSAFKPRGRFKATVLSQVLGIFRFKFLFPDHKLGPNLG